MRVKLLLCLLLLVLLSCSVFAVKPTPQASSAGIEIVYPKAQAYSIGSNFSVYIMAFNLSSTLPLTNVSTLCTFYISNHSDNGIVFVKNFSYYTTYVFGVDIPTSAVAEVGFYPYAILCNAGTIAGYVSDELLVSSDGEGELSSSGGLFVFAIILLPLVFAFLLFKWGESLSDDFVALKLGVGLFCLLMVVVSLWFSSLAVIKFYLWSSMVDALTLSTRIIVIFFSALVMFLLIWFMVKVFEGINDARKAKRGLD